MAARRRVRRPAGAPSRVAVGMKFRATYADGNPLWEVTRKSGRSAWVCVCVNEPFEHDGRKFDSDFAGTERAFLSKEILASAAYAAMFDNLHNESDAWWASRKVGETLHYHNAFGKFVRGIVVEQDGEKKLCPTALVGKWDDYDLPQRRPDGSIHLGYHAEKIQEKDAWQANSGCMYEADPGRLNRYGDPSKMDAIDLSVPELVGEAAAKAKLEQAKQAISTLADDYQSDPRETLAAILKVAQGALA